jgi:hypothetical protein
MSDPIRTDWAAKLPPETEIAHQATGQLESGGGLFRARTSIPGTFLILRIGGQAAPFFLAEENEQSMQADMLPIFWRSAKRTRDGALQIADGRRMVFGGGEAAASRFIGALVKNCE